MSAEDKEMLDWDIIEEMLSIYEAYDETIHDTRQLRMLSTADLCRSMKSTLPVVDASTVARVLKRKCCRLVHMGEEWNWELAYIG